MSSATTPLWLENAIKTISPWDKCVKPLVNAPRLYALKRIKDSPWITQRLYNSLHHNGVWTTVLSTKEWGTTLTLSSSLDSTRVDLFDLSQTLVLLGPYIVDPFHHMSTQSLILWGQYTSWSLWSRRLFFSTRVDLLCMMLLLRSLSMLTNGVWTTRDNRCPSPFAIFSYLSSSLDDTQTTAWTAPWA